MNERMTPAAKVHGIADAMIDSKRPTLAEMSPEEREACRWMLADVENVEAPAIIIDPCWEDGVARVVWPWPGGFNEPPTDWEKVTPRPNPPRMTWPGDQ